MIAAYQRISRADGDLGKDGKDKSNSIENQKELIQRYISCKESGVKASQRHLLHRSAISLTRTKRAHLSLTRQQQKSCGAFLILRF